MIVKHIFEAVDVVDGVNNTVVFLQKGSLLNPFRNRGLHDGLGQWTTGVVFVASLWGARWGPVVAVVFVSVLVTGRVPRLRLLLFLALISFLFRGSSFFARRGVVVLLDGFPLDPFQSGVSPNRK